jgi:hypothetical protein
MPCRASSRHPGVLLLSRGRVPEGPRNGTPRVYSVRRRFSAPAHGTHRKPGFCVVCLPAIRAFQRHSTQHFLRYGPPFGFHFCFRSVPSGLVQRTGCSACGLGYPHQVWWAPHVHSSCLAPVSFAGCQRTSACSPPGLSLRFSPTAGLYKRLSQQKKSGSPTGSRLTAQVLRLFLLLLSPSPCGGGARSGISPVLG